jgi:hypothetical protein
MTIVESIAIGIVIGIVGEAGARILDLWRYRAAHYPILNVLLMFGVVMGTVAMLAATLSWVTVFAIAFGIGLAYEVVNLAYLDWWRFPNDRLGPFRGPTACAVAIAVAWGAVPLLIAALGRVV